MNSDTSKVEPEVEITLDMLRSWSDEELADLIYEIDAITLLCRTEIDAWLESLEGGITWKPAAEGGNWIVKHRNP
jgi:hypothetical protein